MKYDTGLPAVNSFNPPNPPSPTRNVDSGANKKVNAVDIAKEPLQQEKCTVPCKDLTKFDIFPQNIKNEQDTRTTVMVRNIPKTCTREIFVDVLARCGLKDKYSFLYMPFDKRWAIHCGFAFVNLKTPQDVLRLHEFTQSDIWGSLGTRQNGASPVLSYARLQGHERLVQHFYPSAVMRDLDERKRPLFLPQNHNKERTVNQPDSKHEGMPAKVNFDNFETSPLQPCYVKIADPPPGLMTGPGVTGFDFLMSYGAGA